MVLYISLLEEYCLPLLTATVHTIVSTLLYVECEVIRIRHNLHVVLKTVHCWFELSDICSGNYSRFLTLLGHFGRVSVESHTLTLSFRVCPDLINLLGFREYKLQIINHAGLLTGRQLFIVINLKLFHMQNPSKWPVSAVVQSLI